MSDEDLVRAEGVSVRAAARSPGDPLSIGGLNEFSLVQSVEQPTEGATTYGRQEIAVLSRDLGHASHQVVRSER
jgi:hypothetical protein